MTKIFRALRFALSVSLLAAAAPFAVIGSNRSRVARLAWPVALALAGFSMLGLLLHGFAGLRQMNGPLVALLLPIHIAVLGALYHGGSGIPSPAGDDMAVVTAPAAT